MANVAIDLLGMHFRNPVIPAAGPNVGTAEHLRRAAEGGAGGLLAKTICVRPAQVPRPNMYRYGTTGMLNAELWSELPPEDWLEREYPAALAAARRHGLPLIASIGYTPDELRRLGPRVEAAGVDAIEFSVHYLDPSQLLDTARALRESVSVPIIAKFSPHAGDLGELARAIEPHVDAFCCINSFGPVLSIDVERIEPVLGSELGYGWISGSPLKPLALRSVFEVARATARPVIGVGGITSGRDVIEFFMAGASLVGVCTAAILRGPGVYGRIAQEAGRWLDHHGYRDISEVQGLYVRKFGRGRQVVTEKVRSARVLAERCNGCTACETVCHYDAIRAPRREVAQIAEDRCTQCGLCLWVCPPGALTW